MLAGAAMSLQLLQEAYTAVPHKMDVVLNGEPWLACL